MGKLRKRLLPQSVSDGVSVFILTSLIQILYWFEVFMVLPKHYEDNIYIYAFHCVLSTWFLFNVMGNYVFLYLTDTSIQGKMLSSDFRPYWKYCEVCETLTPPRSWHCHICKTCILKRDHHCNFAACCVGHLNHRYFLLFLFYLSVAGLYCAYYNAIFLWNTTSFAWSGIMKVVFPLAIFFSGSDMSLMQIYRVLCVTTILGMIFVIAISMYYVQSATKGLVVYERANGIKDYQLGSVRENVIQALGERWYLVWISPFIYSRLPNDGIDWKPVKMISNKSK
ncbi:probable palmitoyltransferase ZDHHC24 [Cimex lectularius]|uniref:Palmitoyltransferase n=1 Tax=Cimex lectularius TaxID=79782 RepID=A0A8I6TGJ2_CIMLE|nr:probable palmitoyltransferase ZDHHC24 [Cimex lectularius]